MNSPVRQHRAFDGSALKSSLSNIAEIAKLISNVDDLDNLLGLVNRSIVSASDWTSASIIAIDFNANQTLLISDANLSRGSAAPSYLVQSWKADVSPAARVARTDELLVIEDAQSQDDYPSYRAQAITQNFRTVVLVPINATDYEGRSLVLSLKSRVAVPFGENDRLWAQSIGGLITLAVNKINQLRHEQKMSTELRTLIDRSSGLMRRAFSSSRIEDVLEEGAKMLPRCFAVADFLTRSVWCVRGQHGDERSGQRIDRQVLPREVLDILLELTRSRGSTLEQDPHCLPLDDGDDPRNWYIETMEADGEMIGAFLVEAREGGLDPFELVVAQAVQFGVCAQMTRHFVEVRSVALSRTDVLQRIFEDDFKHREHLLSHGNRNGLDLTERHHMLIIRDQSSNAGGSEDSLRRTQAIKRSIGYVLGGAEVIHYLKDFIILLAPELGKKLTVPHLRSRIFREIRAVVSPEASLLNCGVFHSPETLRRTYLKADKVLGLAKSSGLTGWVDNDELGSSLVLLSLAEKNVVTPFLESELKQIIDYDRNNNTQFFDTLRVFAENEGRFQKCADELGLHATTLRYRLGRIEELFDIDVTQPAKRFDINLATKLMSVHGKSSE